MDKKIILKAHVAKLIKTNCFLKTKNTDKFWKQLKQNDTTTSKNQEFEIVLTLYSKLRRSRESNEREKNDQSVILYPTKMCLKGQFIRKTK